MFVYPYTQSSLSFEVFRSIILFPRISKSLRRIFKPFFGRVCLGNKRGERGSFCVEKQKEEEEEEGISEIEKVDFVGGMHTRIVPLNVLYSMRSTVLKSLLAQWKEDPFLQL